MLAKLNAFALVGIDAVPVEVEVDAGPGVAKVILVGLPELAVRESIHRVERALHNLGYARPTGRTVFVAVQSPGRGQPPATRVRHRAAPVSAAAAAWLGTKRVTTRPAGQPGLRHSRLGSCTGETQIQ